MADHAPRGVNNATPLIDPEVARIINDMYSDMSEMKRVPLGIVLWY